MEAIRLRRIEVTVMLIEKVMYTTPLIATSMEMESRLVGVKLNLRQIT